MSLSERIISAEKKIAEAEDELATALALGTPARKRRARKAWRAAQKELSEALDEQQDS